MAFELGTFITKWFADTSQLNSAMDESKKQAGELGKEFVKAGNNRITPDGLNATKEGLKQATEASQGLVKQLLEIAGISMPQLLQFGTLAGIAGAIGLATRSFMQLQDEARNVGNRFKMLGLDAESNTQKFFDFGRQMSESFGIAQSEARALQMTMLQRGTDPTRFRQMAAAAVGFGEALGVSTQRAGMLITQLEAGNYQILARMHPAFRRLIQMGASRQQIEAKVNEMVAMGASLAQERTNSFSGQVNRLKNNFVELGMAVAAAVGPAIAPIIGRVASAVGDMTRRITAWVQNNKEAVGGLARMAAASAAAVVGFKGLGLAIAYLPGVLGAVLPGFGLLRGALGGLGGIGGGVGAIFGMVRGMLALAGVGTATGWIGGVAAGIRSLFGVFGNLRGSVMSLVRAMGTSLAGAAGVLGVVVNNLGGFLLAALNPMTAVRLALGALRLAVNGLRGAITGLLAMTGIGLLIGLVGALAGATDTFGETTSAVGSLGSMLYGIWTRVLEVAKPVIDWLKTEGVIIFQALVASARQVIDVVVDVCRAIYSIFEQAMEWLLGLFGFSLEDIVEVWKNFTAELAVIGLRMRQIFYAVVIAIMAIPTVVSWLGDVFMAFVDWFTSDWWGRIKGILNLYMEYLKLLGTAVMDLGKAAWGALKGEGFHLDFSNTRAQMEALKDAYQDTFKDLKIPGLDISKVAPEMQAKLGAVTEEIEKKKAAAREQQDRLRDAKNGTGGGGRSAGTGPEGAVRVGHQDKAHFSDVAGFWKKLQEAAASQRVEHVMEKQLDQQQQMVALLKNIAAQSHLRGFNPTGVPEPGVFPQ